MKAFRGYLLIVALAMCALPRSAHGVQFTSGHEVTWDSIREDTRSFFSNIFLGGVDEDGDGVISEPERANSAIFRSAVLAALLVGVSCGLLGSFITLRRMALFGDMLGHAVLPGIAVGFILVGEKQTLALLLGALGAGILAALLTKSIRSWSKVKEDAALGISLSFFYAVGVWLLSWITHSKLKHEASGLNQYLFGNPAVILPADLVVLVATTFCVVAVVTAGYKEFLVSTFDPCFSASIGIPRSKTDPVLLLLLTVVIVVSIKILGIVLVAAMLTIPAATAYLLTDRFKKLCLGSCAIGALAGFGGTYLSVIFHVGMGPAIVCLAFFILVVVFLTSPRHGVLARHLQHRRQVLRTHRENILAAAYRVGETEGIAIHELPLEKIAAVRREPVEATRSLARKLRGSGWGAVRNEQLVLTQDGERRAGQVVRTHRLWELFLSREASLPPDHVHPAAEDIEHYLNEETIAELEKLLGHPQTDPHGRAIPSDLQEIAPRDKST